MTRERASYCDPEASVTCCDNGEGYVYIDLPSDTVWLTPQQAEHLGCALIACATSVRGADVDDRVS